MIPSHPESCELTLELRPLLHPLFCQLPEGVSEFSFAGLYLFRQSHQYRIARLPDPQARLVILGRDGEQTFFMLPFGLPDPLLLHDLFELHGMLKAATLTQATQLAAWGFRVVEDRDNCDYLYSRTELSNLPGQRFHKKKNLVNAFIRDHDYVGQPLLAEHVPDALKVLDTWLTGRPDSDHGDHAAAREALVSMEALQLCGGIYHVDGEPAAWTLGEENAQGTSFVIHFEKACHADRFKGIYQFVNQAFAQILPEKYVTINREQDLGDPGLRQAKESYRPTGFVKKHRVWLC